MNERAVIVLAVVAGVLVYLRGRTTGGTASEPLTIHIDKPDHWQPAVDAFAGWFAPSSFGTATPTRTSARGIEVIKRHEGLRLTVYTDAAGHKTIGYGHKLLPGEHYTRITEAEAGALLRADLAAAENAVRELVTVRLDQSQFDALVSFTFNLGRANLASSTLLRKLNAGDYVGAAAEFERWNKAGGRVLAGLVARRADEAALFSSTLYV